MHKHFLFVILGIFVGTIFIVVGFTSFSSTSVNFNDSMFQIRTVSQDLSPGLILLGIVILGISVKVLVFHKLKKNGKK